MRTAFVLALALVGLGLAATGGWLAHSFVGQVTAIERRIDHIDRTVNVIHLEMLRTGYLTCLTHPQNPWVFCRPTDSTVIPVTDTK